MTDPSLGPRVAALRRKAGLSQAELARRLDISASYLNLIEKAHRPLTAALLIKLARQLDLDLDALSDDDDARLVADLLEIFGDPVFEGHALTNADVRDAVAASPTLSRAIRTLYAAWQESRAGTEHLYDQMQHEAGDTGQPAPARLPSEEVHDLIERHRNHFPALEEAAEALIRDAGLGADDLHHGLVRALERQHGVRVAVSREHQGALRRYEPDRRQLLVSEVLAPRSRNFQLAVQLGLLGAHATLDRLVDDPNLTTDESRALARVALANYFAGAVLMPYGPFLEAARAERYDVELIGHRFRASYEQVCHRLTTLSRPGAEGVPFHLIRVDIAGNISKRFSGSGIRFARYAGACPRWNVFAAFLTPEMIRVQLSQMPDGATYFCFSRTITTRRGGYHAAPTLHAIGLGCRVEHARKLVYSDGVNLEHTDAAVPIGTTCRLCARPDCAQRAFPPLASPLSVDENVRAVNLYAPGR